MDDQNRNLILASVLSFLVIVAWFFFFPPPEPVQTSAVEATDASTNQQTSALPGVEKSASSATGQTVSTAEDAPRISIETQKLMGTISLKGGRIDDLSLLGYKVDLSEGAENVTLLKPVGAEGAYYATYGWAALSGVTSNLVPTPDTLWE
ncbi:MAG: membrane protein insertase YidC, partial [Paracoccaceae bacterium]